MIGFLSDLSGRLGALSGRRRIAAAVLLGAAAALALPPLDLLPFAFVGFCGLVAMLESGVAASSPRAAFWTGWWFGFGHFTLGLYWIANALLIDWQIFGWMIPFAVFGLAALLGVFTGLATLATCLACARGFPRVFALAIAWTCGEWLRGHVLTGFPWNLMATIWDFSPTMLQGVSVFGAYGLSALTVLVVAAPAGLLRAGRWRYRDAVTAVIAAGLVAGAWAAGSSRLAAADIGIVPDVRLRLVQPNVPQELKWDPEAREANLQRMIEMSRLPGFETRTHVIWSETATAFPIWGDNDVLAMRRAQIAAAVPPGGILVTGAPRVVRETDGSLRAWNSLHALDQTGRIVATFDKFHLVPFGEYVPLRAYLPVDRIVPGTIDFSAGPGPRSIEIPGLPLASPLICYEIIFPGKVVAPDERPGVLLNLTNDSWFGQSAGPYQHFAAARLRAIEEGLPLIRSAGGGISAIVDPFGRIQAALGLGQTGVLDADLPMSLLPTLFARYGEAAFLFVLVSIAISGAFVGLITDRTASHRM
ncbi:MAG: apolipoprotein N-acyltransferase [Alphaproteobacteria bacterium]|nr:apolipoprotein N-acyltransferase [Alphaproteobacteria bacterium]